MRLTHGRQNALDLLIRTEDYNGNPPDPPRHGLRPHDVVCHVKRSGSLAWVRKDLTPANWQDSGYGVYVLTLEADDIADASTVTLLVGGAPGLKPPILPFQETFEVEQKPQRGTTPIPETILIGRLVTLAEQGKPKAQVTARVAQFPLVVGGVAITNDPIMVETDDEGAFELHVVTGALIQVNIPAVQYQRQFIVPPPPAPGIPVRLFSL
jgi:hypothetical protein